MYIQCTLTCAFAVDIVPWAHIGNKQLSLEMAQAISSLIVFLLKGSKANDYVLWHLHLS